MMDSSKICSEVPMEPVNIHKDFVGCSQTTHPVYMCLV